MTCRLHVVGAITGDPICDLEVDEVQSLQELKAPLCLRRVEPVSHEAICDASGIPPHEQRLARPERLSDGAQVELLRADAQRAAALEHVAQGGSLTQLAEQHRGDPELVLAALKSNGGAFRHASARLKQDRGPEMTG